MKNKADIVRQWYQDVWIDGKWDQVEKLYQPAADNMCLVPGETANLYETKDLIMILNDLVSEREINVLNTVEQGDWVSAMIEFHGLKTGTDLPVYLRWVVMTRVKDDCIVESYPSIGL